MFSSHTLTILQVACYQNYCISCNHILLCDRDHQVHLGGWSNYVPNKSNVVMVALLTTVKSQCFCNVLSNFDEIWYDDTYWPPSVEWPLTCRIFENARWRGSHLENHKNCDILAMVGLTFTKFGMVMQNGCLNCLTIKNLKFKDPRWWTVAILKTVHSPYLCNHSTVFDEIWHNDAHWTPTADQPLKFWIFENAGWWWPPSWE